jgi:hypothetical protein
MHYNAICAGNKKSLKKAAGGGGGAAVTYTICKVLPDLKTTVPRLSKPPKNAAWMCWAFLGTQLWMHQASWIPMKGASWEEASITGAYPPAVPPLRYQCIHHVCNLSGM